MSLMAAVDIAVRLQIVRDTRIGVLDYTLFMAGTPATPATGTTAAVPATGYGYNAESMLQLLEQVSTRLRIDEPSLRFDWARADVTKCLQGSLLTLVGLIASDTVAAEGART